MSEVIAVLGATGRTGGATLRSLVERGARVRALTRDPEAEGARRLAHPLVDLVAADMHDPGSLGSALAGVDRLLSVQPGFDNRGRHQYEQEVAQGTAVAAAASEVGVRHVVQMAAGPGVPTGLSHFDAKLVIREEFARRGITVDAVHPGPFMETMVDPSFAPALGSWGVEPRIVGWDRPVPWVAVDDIGHCAADLLTGAVPAGGGTHVLIGDVRSLRECRELVAARTGRRPRRLPIPTRVLTAMLGPELVDMWRWIAGQSDLTVSDPGRLLTVEQWLDGRVGQAPRAAAAATAGAG